MPELAEVEYGRKIAEHVGRGRRITRLWCAPDPIVFEKRPASEWDKALVGARVESVRRHGKQLWFELDTRPWPLFHFGMTGSFHTPGATPLQLASSPKGGDPPWPPRFAKIHLIFEDGGELVMTNKRRLGRLRLREDPQNEDPIRRLGFDPLTALPSLDVFGQRLRRRRSPVKAVLLDQAFAAGLGNWLADEICYQARIDPRARANELGDEAVASIRRVMSEIIQMAVSVDADKKRFPVDWLFHRRWGRPEEAETRDGHAIEFLTVGGRTTAWVPAIQQPSDGA